MSEPAPTNTELETYLEKLIQVFHKHFPDKRSRKKHREKLYEPAISIAKGKENLFKLLSQTGNQTILEEFTEFNTSVYDQNAREYIAKNVNAPMDILDSIRNYSFFVQLKLVSNANASKELLEYLARYGKNYEIKERAKERL